jgi:hypothetical protein
MEHIVDYAPRNEKQLNSEYVCVHMIRWTKALCCKLARMAG